MSMMEDATRARQHLQACEAQGPKFDEVWAPTPMNWAYGDATAAESLLLDEINTCIETAERIKEWIEARQAERTLSDAA